MVKVRYNKLMLEQYIVFMLKAFAYVNYSFITSDKKSKDYNYVVIHKMFLPDFLSTHPLFYYLHISTNKGSVCAYIVHGAFDTIMPHHFFN